MKELVIGQAISDPGNPLQISDEIGKIIADLKEAGWKKITTLIGKVKDVDHLFIFMAKETK